MHLCCTHSNIWHILAHITCSCVYVMPKSVSCSIILSMSCSLCFVAFFFLCFCLMFELHFLIHLAPLMHHILPLFISSSFFLIPLDWFVYSWQKGGVYTGYTGVFRHFYMTHVHILKGRNSTLSTFVGGENYRGDAYTKREKTFSLFCFGLYYSCALVGSYS